MWRPGKMRAPFVRLLLINTAWVFLGRTVIAQTDGTGAIWITAVIDGQTVSWLNNYSPTSVAYTPSPLASSYFDPVITSTSTTAATTSETSSRQTSPASTPQTQPPSSTSSSTDTSDSSVESSSSSSLPTTSAQGTAGASEGESNTAAQSQSGSKGNDHSNKVGVIVGVVLGVVAIALLALLVLWSRRRRRRRRRHTASLYALSYPGDSEKARSAVSKRESELPMLAHTVGNTGGDNSLAGSDDVSSPPRTAAKLDKDAEAGLSSSSSADRDFGQEESTGSADYENPTKDSNKHQVPVPHGWVSDQHRVLPAVLVTRDTEEDRLSQHSRDEVGQLIPAVSESSYGGLTRDNSVRVPPTSIAPTMSRPHPLRPDPASSDKPEFGRLHSYQTIAEDNPFGELQSAAKPLTGFITNTSAGENSPRGHSGDNDLVCVKCATTEAHVETQHNWLGELRSPSPLLLSGKFERATEEERPPSHVSNPRSTTVTHNAVGQRDTALNGPQNDEVHLQDHYSDEDSDSDFTPQRPKFVPGVHQITREEQYRQNRAARSVHSSVPSARDAAPRPLEPSSLAPPPKSWRKSQPTHYLTQQEASTFDFGQDNSAHAQGRRRSFPARYVDARGRFGFIRGQKVEMYEGV